MNGIYCDVTELFIQEAANPWFVNTGSYLCHIFFLGWNISNVVKFVHELVCKIVK